MLSRSDAIDQEDACSTGLNCGVGLLQHRALFATASHAASREAFRADVARERVVDMSKGWYYLGDDGAGGSSNPEVPSAMQAVHQQFGGKFHVETAPVPSPGPGQALVRVEGSSVNPIDWKMPLPGPVGRDFAGTVISVEAPCGVSTGDNVWGDAPTGAGAWAEYLVVDCGVVGRRSDKIGAPEAGVMPHVALTALQALSVAGAPWSPSARPAVLVLGGSGGVGHVALQIAKAMGAGEVSTTCSASNFDFVKAHGADRVFDYHEVDWWEALGENSVDVVFDTVGMAGTGRHAETVLRANGTFVTTLPDSTSPSTRPDVRQVFVSLSDVGTTYLDTLTSMVDAGNLSAAIQVTYPLEDISQAIAHSKAGHTVGKVALSVGGAVAAE